ncbi:MAG: hypothetical protein V3T72_23500, partial [Thermoanaerobaculia bacterium]
MPTGTDLGIVRRQLGCARQLHLGFGGAPLPQQQARELGVRRGLVAVELYSAAKQPLGGHVVFELPIGPGLEQPHLEALLP